MRMTNFGGGGGCWISQHTWKQWRKEEEDHKDHETNKKKSMKICNAMKSKDEHHKGEKAWSLRIMKPRRRRKWEICNAKKSRNKHHKGERHEACISFKSWKPWKVQILMKFIKLEISRSLESWLESSKLKKARHSP